jgi:hypothetical protein
MSDAGDACVIANASALSALRHREIATGELRATSEGISIAGATIVARDRIASAHLWPSAKLGTFVCIRRHGLRGDVHVRVANLDEGRAVLRALGLDATQSATELTIAGTSAAHVMRRLATFLAMIPLSVALAVAALVLGKSAHAGFGPSFAIALALGVSIYALGFAQMAARAHVTVGADGVLVRWLWQRRFFRIADIASAEVVGPRGAAPSTHSSIFVRLKLRSGEVLDLCVALRKRGVVSEGAHDWARMRGEMIAERIREAIEAHGPGGDAPWSASALSRGERSVPDWLAWLRDVRARVATFREGIELARDELWRVVEDPTASAEHRAAAAVALAPDLDDDGKSKLRIAARAAAAPKLRVALEAAADADDERLTSALDEIAPSRVRDG